MSASLPPDDPFAQLEKTLDAALRAQPALRAPASLELRVRAQIARRGALPWWRRSFGAWPVAVRAVFVVLSAAAGGACVAGALALFHGPGARAAAGVSRDVAALQTAVQSAVSTGAELLGGLSPEWWYLGIAVVAVAYAAMLGLGAAAYRLLWEDR